MIKIEKIQREVIKIKNLYNYEVLIEDIKEQIKIFGKNARFDMQEFGEFATSGRPYLPEVRFKLWKRHLVMSYNYLSLIVNDQPKKFEKYMNNRFGNNWIITKPFNDIRVILIKNILDKPLSIKKETWNNWKMIGNKFSRNIFIEKINIEDMENKSNLDVCNNFQVTERLMEELDKGIFYTEENKNGQ